MDFSRQLFKEMLATYLETKFSQILPVLIAEAIQGTDLLIGQDFISLDEATRRYHLCRKTLYNYHNKSYITFVSIRELEAHIKKHPLPRNLGMKMAA